MRKDKKYEIGQKIPNNVDTYSKQELKNRDLKCQHSSILRILTKWTENLEYCFEYA